MSGSIYLDVLVRAHDSPERITVENIGRARPDPDVVERCRRWLAARGLECHATDFGVVCKGHREQVARVFGSATAPRPPAEIARFVEQVSVTPPPEFF